MAGPLNAFVPDSNAYLAGADGGPLSGLTFAAKDIFDIAGHVTGCGNPYWLATHGPAEANAWVVQRLVDAGAAMVGKTITDELTAGYSARTCTTAPRSIRMRPAGCPAAPPAGRRRPWPGS